MKRIDLWWMGLFLCIFAGIFAGCARGPELTVEFDKEQPVEVGTPVVLQGVEIGKVTGIDLAGGKLQVRIRLDRKRSEAIPRKSMLLVEEGDIERPTQMVVHVLDRESPPAQEGDRLEGADSPWEVRLRKSRQIASHVWNDLSGKSRGFSASLHDTIEELSRSEGMKRVRQELEGVARSVEYLGKHPEEISREIERMRGQLEPAIKELYAKNLAPAADQLKKEFEAFVEEIERTRSKEAGK